MNQWLASAWESLGPIWREVFRLGWEALGHGTVPVGAILADDSGAIVARGRNRIYDDQPSGGRLARTRLAHAEVDALIDLDPKGWYSGYTLYSMLEPCLLCIGATVMSTVGTLTYAGRDPYGGADGAVTGVNAHVERVPVRLVGPIEGPFGEIATLLHVAYYLDRKPEGYVVAAHERVVPSLMPAARLMLNEGLLAAARADEPIEVFLGRLGSLHELSAATRT
jgi:tRNA(Arg) A34 adenosine deaminase TadA